MKTWGIIGLGWLGKELAATVKKNGDIFWGTQSQNFDIRRAPVPGKTCDVLLLNTPPLKEMTATKFVEHIVLPSNAKLIFISSTSVYGTNVGTVTEHDSPNPKSENGLWLLEVENRLLQKFSGRVSIVRPGGLIGGQRHPINHLSGRSGISGASSLVNLIHRIDLINIILLLSETDPIVPIANAVAPAHPRKDDYYFEWADKLKIPRPIFDTTESESQSREIASNVLPKLYKKWSCPNLDFI